MMSSCNQGQIKTMWLSFPLWTTINFPADGCFNYSTLSEANRKSTYVTPYGTDGECDDSLPAGWYRFVGAAGTKMPTTLVRRFHCNTAFSGWMNGAQPTMEDGEVIRTVCFTRASHPCKLTNKIKVKNCGSYFIYKLVPVTTCKSRYCGSG